MDTAEHNERLKVLADRFAEGLADAQSSDRLSAVVPSCPAWTVRDLAEHVGGIYRWVTRLVDEAVAFETWRSEMPIDYPTSDDEVAAWFQASIEPLLSALMNTPPDQVVWGWGPHPHARFWSRRLMHESTVHLDDLLGALGRELPIDDAVAIDGIDEFLTNLPSTARWGAPIDLLRGTGETLILSPTDVAERWRLRFEPTGFWWDRGSSPADAVLAGPVADLCLSIQGRQRAAVVESGRSEVIDRWRSALDF